MLGEDSGKYQFPICPFVKQHFFSKSTYNEAFLENRKYVKSTTDASLEKTLHYSVGFIALVIAYTWSCRIAFLIWQGHYSWCTLGWIFRHQIMKIHALTFWNALYAISESLYNRTSLPDKTFSQITLEMVEAENFCCWYELLVYPESILFSLTLEGISAWNNHEQLWYGCILNKCS